MNNMIFTNCLNADARTTLKESVKTIDLGIL